MTDKDIEVKKGSDVKGQLEASDPKEALKEWAGSAIHFDRLDLEKKRLFVDNSFRYWPNISRLCASVGVSPASYHSHIKLHPDFAQFMKAVDLAVTDDIEMVLRYEAGNPKSFLDRMAYLRAHRPELYDRAKVVKIEGYKMTDGERDTRRRAVETVIDAEVTSSYLNRKQRQEQKRQARLSEGEAGGGAKAGGA